MNMPLMVSAFAGVGGIDLAAHRAGVKVTTAIEIDKQARGVIAEHFPDTMRRDDIREVTGDELTADGFNPTTGILAGGFPCQDLSVAGARRGMDRSAGTRSGLYWELDRLMAELSPRWVVLENVPGLLSQGKGGAMGAVIGSLAERGYGWAYRVLDAQHFGVPQRRRRVVIVGCLGDPARAAQVLFEPPSSSGSDTACQPSRPYTTATPTASAGTDSRTAESAAGGQLIPVTVAGDKTHTLLASGCDASEDGTGRGNPIVTWQKVRRSGKRDEHGRLPAETWAHRDVAATLSSFDANEHRAVELVTFHAAGARRLTPREWERLQGFPDDWTATSWGTPQADTPRYKQLGNAVAVPVFTWVLQRLSQAAHTSTEPPKH